MSEPLLEVRGLRVSIGSDEGEARVLDFIDFDLRRGEALGLVGESGCGKSTVLKAILGLLPRSARVLEGEIRFKGENLTRLRPAEIARRIRGRAMGFVPQDPFQSFNPVFTVGAQMLEILRWSGLPGEERARWTRATRARARERLIEVLRTVQIPDPEEALGRYPHQFSGGQRQRILIAGALAAQPEVILADEPTTALDVTTQMQILRLMRRLAHEFDVAMLFVSHDFGAVAQLCDRVTVIYAGQTAEIGTATEVITNPQHPYTRALIDCHPDREGSLEGIPGQVGSPLLPPSGCRFHPRCSESVAICSAARPDLVRTAPTHRVACVHARPA